MDFRIAPLPYSKRALEPHISELTLDVHYEKHHKGYLEKLAKLVAGKAEEHETLEELIRTAEGEVFENAAQVWNHAFYWKSLRPEAGRPEGELSARDRGVLRGFREPQGSARRGSDRPVRLGLGLAHGRRRMAASASSPPRTRATRSGRARPRSSPSTCGSTPITSITCTTASATCKGWSITCSIGSSPRRTCGGPRAKRPGALRRRRKKGSRNESTETQDHLRLRRGARGALLALAPLAAAAEAPDPWLTTKVKLSLLSSEGVDGLDVNVDTVDGRVTLHGTAATASERAQAEQLARQVQGVREVRNLIQVVPANLERRRLRRGRDDRGAREGGPRRRPGAREQQRSRWSRSTRARCSSAARPTSADGSPARHRDGARRRRRAARRERDREPGPPRGRGDLAGHGRRRRSHRGARRAERRLADLGREGAAAGG